LGGWGRRRGGGGVVVEVSSISPLCVCACVCATTTIASIPARSDFNIRVCWLSFFLYAGMRTRRSSEVWHPPTNHQQQQVNACYSPCYSDVKCTLDMPNISAIYVYTTTCPCLSASAKDTGSAANETARIRDDGVYTWVQAAVFMILCGSLRNVKVECS